ncbi:hypothetical protein LUZ60_011566 [Juncus effusus]|nr:hypothetical protein LUZ60_011566 [Juncus effusus]
MMVYHGDVCLGEVDVFSFPSSSSPFPFPSEREKEKGEIRISHLSPPSERCPPLAVLQTISPFCVRCKLQAKSITTHPHLHHLYLTCFQEFKSAVVVVGDGTEEVHLVAMPSKVEKVSCFWCCSVKAGLYASCMAMLNLWCLSIVFDIDETLIVANTMKSFDDRIDALSRKIDAEDDPFQLSGMSSEIKRYIEDRDLLRHFVDSDSVPADNTGRLLTVQNEEVVTANNNDGKVIYRPVIRLPEKNVVLTRIIPDNRDTSVFVRLRPAWEDLRSYLTAKGRKRFEVYVCTMAERDYALEIWRLLDPEFNLISSKQLSARVVCVKAGSKKSLQNVFEEGGCHPKMAMVIDDRLVVWEDKDQPRVHVVPAFTPYYAPQAETANALPVLCVARNVACNVRGGFFKEFDENLLRKVFEVCYENDVVDLPYSPDVSNYLLSEVPSNNTATNAVLPPPLAHEGIYGAEVERALNGPPDDRQTPSTRPPEDETGVNRAPADNRNGQFDGPTLYISVLQEIARRCESKVEFRSTVKNLHFSVEVLLSTEKVGIGMGRTREEAQLQAAENALRNLASSYLAFVAPITRAEAEGGGLTNNGTNDNGFLDDAVADAPSSFHQ